VKNSNNNATAQSNSEISQPFLSLGKCLLKQLNLLSTKITFFSQYISRHQLKLIQHMKYKDTFGFCWSGLRVHVCHRSEWM